MYGNWSQLSVIVMEVWARSRTDSNEIVQSGQSQSRSSPVTGDSDQVRIDLVTFLEMPYQVSFLKPKTKRALRVHNALA